MNSSNPFESIFGGIFNPIRPGDRVEAQLDPNTHVAGVLKSLPKSTMGFCVVNGIIIKSGVPTYDKMILVPQNLLQRSQ